MIVVDASALLEFLLQTELGARVEARVVRDDDELHAPHLVDVEIVQGLRRLVRTGELSSGHADEAIADLADPIPSWRVEFPLWARARNNESL